MTTLAVSSRDAAVSWSFFLPATITQIAITTTMAPASAAHFIRERGSIRLSSDCSWGSPARAAAPRAPFQPGARQPPPDQRVLGGRPGAARGLSLRRELTDRWRRRADHLGRWLATRDDRRRADHLRRLRLADRDDRRRADHLR